MTIHTPRDEALLPLEILANVLFEISLHHSFKLIPTGKMSENGIAITDWVAKIKGRHIPLYNADMSHVLRPMMRDFIIKKTFEEEHRDGIAFQIQIEDYLSSEYAIRATEMTEEHLMFEVAIEGDWHPMTSATFDELISYEMLKTAETYALLQE